MKIAPTIAFVVLLTWSFVQRTASADKLELPERWVYYPTNLLVDTNLETLEDVFRRASAVGYSGVLLADSKFGRLNEMDERYFRNVERVKALAAELNLEIVPAIFPIGYSDSILSQDPNLAEGLPVKDALFVVKNGEARLVPDPPVALKGGDFADLSVWDWNDENVLADNGAARVTDPRGQNARIAQKVAVSPFRQYHISVRVKTQEFRGQPEVKAIADGQSLNYAHLGVQRTQDWTTHHVVFNSLNHREVTIYLGCWGGETGSLWWDDAAMEEVGLLNVLRRDGAPLKVEVVKTGETLQEGKGYEPVVDPRMGTVPWKGGYEVWHEPPVIKTWLPDGTQLRVSYYHTITVYDGQVMICPSEPKTVELLRDQAKRMHAAWGADTYFMSHDEIRVLNWDDSCVRRKLDAGQILADNVKTCVRILREVNPGGRIYVWSDMFDPHHNAHADYYLVRGDLSGAWEGLDADVNIAVWYQEKRNESLAWFAGRGHKMLVAGYYDSDLKHLREWLDAARKVGGVTGVMYTTWTNNYEDLERFAGIVNEYRRD